MCTCEQDPCSLPAESRRAQERALPAPHVGSLSMSPLCWLLAQQPPLIEDIIIPWARCELGPWPSGVPKMAPKVPYFCVMAMLKISPPVILWTLSLLFLWGRIFVLLAVLPVLVRQA